jgi:hypothetical protein
MAATDGRDTDDTEQPSPDQIDIWSTFRKGRFPGIIRLGTSLRLESYWRAVLQKDPAFLRWRHALEYKQLSRHILLGYRGAVASS